MVAVVIFAFSALTLVAGRQEGHSAHKNFCLETPWNVVVAVNVSGRGIAQCTLSATPSPYFRKKGMQSFSLSCKDAEDKDA